MKVLFICTANVCRSALAEAILKKKIEEEGLTNITVESAGARNFEGRTRDATILNIRSFPLQSIASVIPRS